MVWLGIVPAGLSQIRYRASRQYFSVPRTAKLLTKRLDQVGIVAATLTVCDGIA